MAPHSSDTDDNDGRDDSSDTGLVLLPMEAIQPLTPRERQVLEMRGNGLSRLEVAKQLSISRDAVDFHSRNAFRKLKADNIIQALLALQKLL